VERIHRRFSGFGFLEFMLQVSGYLDRIVHKVVAGKQEREP
jgi:hypothetical protein